MTRLRALRASRPTRPTRLTRPKFWRALRAQISDAPYAPKMLTHGFNSPGYDHFISRRPILRKISRYATIVAKFWAIKSR